MNEDQFTYYVCFLLFVVLVLFIFARPPRTRRVEIENLIEPEDLQD